MFPYVPRVNEEIHLETTDEIVGGLARVTSVIPMVSGGRIVHSFTVAEVPGYFRCSRIALIQEKSRQEFGQNRAYSKHNPRSAKNKEDR